MGYIRKALEKGFWEMYWLEGGSGTIFFRKLAVTVDRLGFFCLLWFGCKQTATHPYPHYSNIWAYEGQVIRVDLLHLMCRRHVQHGSPQDPNMLKTLTNNYLGHPGDAWCHLQHQAHQSARNQRWQKFSNRLSSWDMRPQYLDSARQNTSTCLLSLSSNSTICRSTHRDTYELVSRMHVRSSLRPENPKTPKSSASVLNIWSPIPPFTHTFLKQPFLTDFKKYTHYPPPPPLRNEILVHWTKN